MVKKPGDAGRVGDRELQAGLDLSGLKDFANAYPELGEIKELVEATRQGLVVVSSNAKAEATAALFTSLLKMELIPKWREAYEEVSIEELLEDARLVSIPMLWEVPEGITVMGHSLIPVRLRRLFLVIASGDLQGLVVFS